MTLTADEAARAMKLYTYVMTSDTGFAPNPFWGRCTLATCKPKIRKHARAGDWVAGVGAKAGGMGGRLIFAMRVDEVVPIERYGVDPRFAAKRPDPAGTARQRVGDNAYYADADGRWRRRPNRHSPDQMAHDLGGRNVLVSEHFRYFGRAAPPIPPELLARVRPGRGHRCNFDPRDVEAFLSWLAAAAGLGAHGDPADFDERCGGERLGDGQTEVSACDHHRNRTGVESAKCNSNAPGVRSRV